VRRKACVLTRLLSLVAIAAVPGVSSAAEIGINLEREVFSGPVPYGEEFQISFVDEPGTTATLSYWSIKRKGEMYPCERDPSSKETKIPTYAKTYAARVEVTGTKHKQVFNVSKLYPDQRYCFVVKAIRARSLSDSEKRRVAKATKETLREMERGLDVSKLPADCRQSVDSDRSRTPACAVASAFAGRLDKQLREQKVRELGDEYTLEEYFARTLDESEALQNELNTLYKKFKDKGQVDTALGIVPDKVDELKGALSRVKHQDKAIHAIKRPPRGALPTIALVPNAAVEYLQRRPKNDDTDAYVKWAKEYDALFKDVLKLQQKCGTSTLPVSERYRVPQSVDASAINELTNAVCNLKIQLDIVIDNIDSNVPGADTVEESSEFKKFSDAVSFVTLEIRSAEAVTEGDIKKAFPFYASVDVGLAPVIFPGKPAGVNLTQYFAVNFYSIAVDPSEPLWGRSKGRTPGENFRRRFSVSLGITSTGTTIDRKYVSGTLGKQLVLFGAGFRLTRLLRISGGTAWYNQVDPNPVKDRTRLRPAIYFGASLDLGVFTLIRDAVVKAGAS